MQYTDIIPYKKSKTTLKGWALFGRMLAIAGVVLLIVWQLRLHQADLGKLLPVWTSGITKAPLWIWPVCVLLMAANWSLEALKWQYLSHNIIKLGFADAVKSVLSGLGLKSLIPHSFGEYSGRILQVDHSERLRLISSVWVGNTSQMAATCLFGAFGLTAFITHFYPGFSPYGIAISGIALTLACLYGVIQLINPLSKLVSHWKWGQYLSGAAAYTLHDWVRLLFLSIIRYTTFLAQFALILYLFEPDLPLSIQLAGITWVYLIKSFAPAFNIVADLGVREFAALSFFPLFGADPSSILAASLSVWFINLFIPSLAGILTFIKFKICPST